MVQGSTQAGVNELFARRREPLDDVAENADAVSRACHAMAVRFHRGGRLFVFGTGACSTDAQHVSVEFVHPVIVGKRALPAMSLTADVATLTGIASVARLADVFAVQLRNLGAPDDIAMGISSDGDDSAVVEGLRAARRSGLLTVGLVGGEGGRVAAESVAEHVLVARSHDPRIVKEVHVTTYHVLWELVHVFFEQPGVLSEQVVA